MADLRIKVTLGTYLIELQGASEDVISQFNDLKKNGLGQIVDQFTNLTKASPAPVYQDQQEPKQIGEPVELTTEDLPSIHDLPFRFIVNTETEWILIYSYYIVKSGKPRFTRQDIISKYEETSRKSQSAIKNLTVYINQNLKKQWLSKQNENEFILTPIGEKQAKVILSRPEGSSTKISKTTKKKKSQDVKDETKIEE